MKKATFLLLILCISGCAGRKNIVLSAAIAKAGQSAARAENAFMSGRIEQTQNARDSIAGLGVAYSGVKDAQDAAIAAEIAYRQSLRHQTDACSPFYLDANGKLFGNCDQATASVKLAEMLLDASKKTLTLRIAELSRKTKSLPHTKEK